jgi:hypothetical protein
LGLNQVAVSITGNQLMDLITAGIKQKLIRLEEDEET